MCFFLTPEYLAKVYKRQTGHNLKDYIIGYRIEMAKQLLADDIKSISDISAEVGFDNFSYFSTVFKKYTGITPGEYRRSKKILKSKKYHLFFKEMYHGPPL